MDAERNERLNVRNNNTSLRLKYVQQNGKDVEQRGSSTGAQAMIAEIQDEYENLPKTNAKDTKHMKVFAKIIAFYEFFGRFLGIKIMLNFPWYKKILFLFSLFILGSVWTCIFYTIHIHFRNDDLVRTLEPLAISGLAMSVSNNTNLFNEDNCVC